MQLAVIDLGSNSFRLEIVSTAGNQLVRAGYWKETVRLAAGLSPDNRLSPQTMRQACTCLARMNERLRGIPPTQVRAVGTQTMRQAANSQEFLRMAERALGCRIEIISGREEARLVFEGCTRTLPRSQKRRLVLDIGGASTELIVGRGFEPGHAESFKIGCVNTTLRHFPGGRIDADSLHRAQVACAAELEEAQSQFRHYGWDEAYGSSGTVGAVSVVLRNQGWTDGTVTVAGLARLRQALIEMGSVQRVKFDDIKPERADVLVGGLAVLGAVFDTFGLREMQTAKGALRAGLLYDLLGRRGHQDMRDTTVARWQLRFGVDLRQAQQVARSADLFHHALQPEAGEEQRRLLRFACLLHEIGFAVSHSDHHKHAAYLVRNGDLPGFSTSDQEAIAELVLGQRGNLRKVFDALRDPVRAGALLAMRLAVILHHARRPVRLPTWSLGADQVFKLTIDDAWLERRPLTKHLLEEETQHWERVGIRLNVNGF